MTSKMVSVTSQSDNQQQIPQRNPKKAFNALNFIFLSKQNKENDSQSGSDNEHISSNKQNKGGVINDAYQKSGSNFTTTTTTNQMVNSPNILSLSPIATQIQTNEAQQKRSKWSSLFQVIAFLFGKYLQLFMKKNDKEEKQLPFSSDPSPQTQTMSKEKKAGFSSTLFSSSKNFNLENGRSDVSIDTPAQELIASNIKNQKTNQKSNGSFNFFKAVALLRKKKVTPLKKVKTPQEIHKLFRRSYIQVLTVIRLNKVCEGIRNFGTSPILFDVAVRSRSAVQKELFPLSHSSLILNNNLKDPQSKLDFPLISPESKFLRIWNPILMTLILYTGTVLPFRIAFQDDISFEWVIFDFILDGMFWIDMIINMFSSYYDDDNLLITKRNQVICTYLKSWFFIDLFCSLPIETLIGLMQTTSNDSCTVEQQQNNICNSSSTSTSQLKLLKLAKLPRLYRLIKIAKVVKMVKYFRNENSLLQAVPVNSGIVRLANLFLLIAAVVHFIGCLWYYQAKLQDFDENTWVYRAELSDSNSISLYLYSLYFVFTTITTVGYGDITPYENSEIIIALILMLIGVGFYSLIIGILSSVIEYMDSKQVLLSHKLEIMNEYCNEMKIPNSIRKKLKEALQYTLEKNCFIWANKSKIIDQLPINLQYDICVGVNKGIMKTFSLFNLTEDQSFVVRMVPQLRPLKLQAGEIIWHQKDIAEAIYLLGSGRVNYLKQVVEDVQTKQKKTIINGSYFGEIDIVLDRKRRYKCQAETQCELYYITRSDYEQIIRKEFPHIHEKLKKISFEREKKNEEALSALKKLIISAKQMADSHNQGLDISKTSTNMLRLIEPSQVSQINGEENQNDALHQTEVIDKTPQDHVPSPPQHETPLDKFQRVVNKINQTQYDQDQTNEQIQKQQSEDQEQGVQKALNDQHNQNEEDNLHIRFEEESEQSISKSLFDEGEEGSNKQKANSEKDEYDDIEEEPQEQSPSQSDEIDEVKDSFDSDSYETSSESSQDNIQYESNSSKDQDDASSCSRTYNKSYFNRKITNFNHTFIAIDNIQQTLIKHSSHMNELHDLAEGLEKGLNNSLEQLKNYSQIKR